jgi:hypothetical protein
MATAPFAGAPARDARVLVAVSPEFDPARPFRLFVFLHGDHSDIEGNVIGERAPHDYRLLRQLARARVSVVLVAPQRHALRRADGSHDRAGSFAAAAGWRAFLAELPRALAGRFGGRPSAYARAPILAGAYSGGHAPLATALAEDVFGRRLKALLLIDAVFAGGGLGPARFAGILAEFLARRPAVTAEVLHGDLAESGAGIAALRDRAAALRAGQLTIRASPVRHGHMPWRGPPTAPTAAFLRRAAGRRPGGRR